MTNATDEQHTQNVLGAFAVAAADRVWDATDDAAGRASTDAAALLLLTTTLDGVSQDGLARSLGMSPSGAARLVDRLVRDGVAQREAGPDRRTFAVHTTPAGRRAARAGLRGRAGASEELLAALNPAEQRTLTRLMEKVLRSLPDSLPAAHHICRICDPVACGEQQHRCPVTKGLDAVRRRDG